MRVSHLIFMVFVAAVLLTVAREPTGRVAIVVFFTGLGEFLLGLTAVMTLFRTVGGIGHARTRLAYFEAIASTLVVLVVASLMMNALLWVGVGLVQRAVP